MVKKLFTYVALVMSVFLLTACPSDDKEDDYNIDTSTSRLVGYWQIDDYLHKTGPNYRNQIVKFILFEEGKIRYEDGQVKEGSWNYNKDTGLLATTAERDRNNWQWEVTMIDDNEWAGLALWLDDKKTMLAKRHNDVNSNIFKDMLLRGSRWESDDYEIHFTEETKTSADGYVKGSTKPDCGRWLSQFYSYNYQTGDDVINYKVGEMNITINHPFSIKKSSMTISGKYIPSYYFKNGVYKRVK